ncbi:MAG: CoA transferase [Desulfobacteraceae bacterium]|nr:MAG: CoA transferase [Desulfobacteraceae bacterium]
MSGPLEGVRVVEITMFQQGPVAGMRLGDLGADVIKVEAKSGDPARGFMKIIGAMAGLKGNNYYFEHNNRNKRGIVLDLKSKSGMEIFLKLIDKADVFLNNMSIGAPIGMGIGPDVLLARNPRLIYAHASGWGRKGPDAHDLSFDYTGIARSGLMMACGERGTPPTQILPGIGDEFGGLMCAWGITAALYAREKTGKGQVVDTSLMGSVIAGLAFILAAPSILGQEFPREVRAEAGNPVYNHYRCSDGKWIAIAHLDPNRYWPRICKALEMEELTDDPRFNSIEARGRNAKELIAILDAKFAAKTREEWMKILKEEECIFTPIQSLTEVTKDPQACANEYFINVEHPEWGKLKMVGFPWSFSETPASWHRPAPGLGQHTDEVLVEAGYTREEIDSFRKEGAII